MERMQEINYNEVNFEYQEDNMTTIYVNEPTWNESLNKYIADAICEWFDNCKRYLEDFKIEFDVPEELIEEPEIDWLKYKGKEIYC